MPDHDCHCHHNNNSGFIFGLVIGALIAAVVAVVVYRNDKNDIISMLQSKLTKFFENILDQKTRTPKPKTRPVHKKPVILPAKITRSQILATSTAVPTSKPRTFSRK